MPLIAKFRRGLSCDHANPIIRSLSYKKTYLRFIFRYSFGRSINAFAILAVLLSITLLFTVNAVMKGFDDELRKLFRGSLSDILVEWRGGGPNLKEVEEKMPKGMTWSPVVESLGMIKTPFYIDGVQVKGVDPEKEKALHQAMHTSFTEFSLLKKNNAAPRVMTGLIDMFEPTRSSPQPVIVGHILAENLGLRKGDFIELSIPNGYGEIGQGDFRICDLFKSGVYEDDRSKVYLHIDEASKMMGRGRTVSYLQILQGSLSVKEIEERIHSVWPEAKVSPWTDRHMNRLSAMASERKLMALIISMIVIVSSFSILSIQWSFVREKVRDIGILRAMGFSTVDIFCIFLGVSWLVGISGLILGFGSGVLLSTYANEVISWTGLNPFPGNLYYHEKLPVKIDGIDFLWIGGLSLLMTTLAGLIPAWRALQVEPIRAIREE